VDAWGPAWLVAGPALAAAVVLLAARAGWPGRGAFVAVVATATFAGVVAQVPVVLAHGRVVASLPAILGELRFTLDGVGLVFALVSSGVWAVASVYATGYLHDDAHRTRYHVTSLLALSAMLGVVTAGDLITLYVFFEWLGLVAYLFVVHVGGRSAERAGLKYLIMTLLGGFAVVAGALIVHALGGGDLSQALPWTPGTEGLRAAAAVLLLAGFGVKAGALGLHLWLPDAHTAAPAPASALLSGVMLKAGAYGILRTVATLFGGAEVGAVAGLLAPALVWWGVATMLLGAFMAFMQTHAKRLLAYSSVSQMGFVLAGIGTAALLGDEGASGWTGTLAHVVNHAVAKALLFLGIGAVIHATGEGDLRRLGGLARRLPWTFAFVLVAAAGVAGVPGLNGFVSKSVLHHALVDAVGHHAAPGLVWAERGFVLATFGTAALLVKLVALVFLAPPVSAGARSAVEVGWRMRAPMAVLAAAVVALGTLSPRLEPLYTAALAALRIEAPVERIVYALATPIGTPGDLQAAALALAAGLGLHVVALSVRLYDRVVPAWASLDRIVLWLLRGSRTLLERWSRAQAAGRSRSVRWLASEGEALRDWSERSSRAQAEGQSRSVRWLASEGEALRDWSERSVPAIEPDELWRRVAFRLGGHWRRLRAGMRWPATALGWWVRRLDTSPWLSDEPTPSASANEVERDRWVRATRRRIARHGRDLGLGVAVLFATWLAFVAVVLWGVVH
jgi:formate hydrogenlyase subunit 3/multisubunit Na+/H+ antiporter MnhD subunit